MAFDRDKNRKELVGRQVLRYMGFGLPTKPPTGLTAGFLAVALVHFGQFIQYFVLGIEWGWIEPSTAWAGCH